ncbi:MAG TPA: monovalent cation/H+ antiporter complex subunit F [Thermoanaerobaculia bacterium]|nr:monovalent cation/H+ antiporter complex subunit F [Thermoanaerobaculia bacterium]
MNVIAICFAILCAATLLAFVRLVKGPTIADRVVALDLLAIISVGVILVYDAATSLPVFLDAAIVLALVGFAGTVAFSKYLERRRMR